MLIGELRNVEKNVKSWKGTQKRKIKFVAHFRGLTFLRVLAFSQDLRQKVE